jgi:hypothetical protein
MRLPPLHTCASDDPYPRDFMTTNWTATAALCAAFTIALAGCEAKKSTNPLSPSVAGPIAGVNITAPRLLEPLQGFKIKESQQPIKLVIENATTNGVRTVTYMFEVASDADFNNKVYARSGVRVHWKDYNHYPEYPQSHGAYAPDLSIIDLLMNCGERAADYVWGHRDARASVAVQGHEADERET